MSETAKRNKGWQWPVMIVVLLVGSVLFNVTVLVISRNTPGFAIEEQYYQKALRWDLTRAQMKRNHTLGWRLSLTLGKAGASQQRRLALSVFDRFSRPIPGATVKLEAFHNARAADKLHAVLAPERTRYVAQLPIARRGLWEFRFVVVKGETQFTAAVRRMVQ